MDSSSIQEDHLLPERSVGSVLYIERAGTGKIQEKISREKEAGKQVAFDEYQSEVRWKNVAGSSRRHFAPLRRLVKKVIPYKTCLSNSINHPNDQGQELFAQALMELI